MSRHAKRRSRWKEKTVLDTKTLVGGHASDKSITRSTQSRVIAPHHCAWQQKLTAP
jgi:hypothetical protein